MDIKAEIVQSEQENPVKKPWETPQFERHEVASLTKAKDVNSMESSVIIGPAS